MVLLTLIMLLASSAIDSVRESERWPRRPRGPWPLDRAARGRWAAPVPGRDAGGSAAAWLLGASSGTSAVGLHPQNAMLSVHLVGMCAALQDRLVIQSPKKITTGKVPRLHMSAFRQA